MLILRIEQIEIDLKRVMDYGGLSTAYVYKKGLGFGSKMVMLME